MSDEATKGRSDEGAEHPAVVGGARSTPVERWALLTVKRNPVDVVRFFAARMLGLSASDGSPFGVIMGLPRIEDGVRFHAMLDLFEEIPEWRPGLERMAIYPGWQSMHARWDDLRAAYADEKDRRRFDRMLAAAIANVNERDEYGVEFRSRIGLAAAPESSRYAIDGARVLYDGEHQPAAVATNGRSLAVANADVKGAVGPFAVTLPKESTPRRRRDARNVIVLGVHATRVDGKGGNAAINPAPFPPYDTIPISENPDDYTLVSFDPVLLARTAMACGWVHDKSGVVAAFPKDERKPIVLCVKDRSSQPAVGVVMPVRFDEPERYARFTSAVSRLREVVAMERAAQTAAAPAAPSVAPSLDPSVASVKDAAS